MYGKKRIIVWMPVRQQSKNITPPGSCPGGNSDERGEGMSRQYELSITEEQARVIMIALEEYFRIRMDQWGDLADELASVGYVYDKNDPDCRKKFEDFIERRDTSRILFEQALDVAQPQRRRGNPMYKTDQMLVAEDIWQVIRHKLYLDKGGDPDSFVVDARKPLQMSDEPLPEMKSCNE